MQLNNVTRRQWLHTAGGAAASSRFSQAADSRLTVRAFEPDGAPCGQERFETLYLTDRNGRPFPLFPQVGGAGKATIELPKEPFELTMVLPVRGFGHLYLYADAGGSLYSSRSGELLLNYEFARSRAAFVRRYLEAAKEEGVSFSPALTARLDRGEAALSLAAKAKDLADRAGHSNDSLAETMWAGEMAAMERARHHINRNGSRPGYLFGCNAFGYARSEEYARRFAELFNFATLPFYRASTEKVEGSPDYSATEAILGKLVGTRILAKGHPLVWFHSAGTPEYLKQKSWKELKQSCREYVLGSVSRFRHRIHSWDVINEAHDWANELNLSQEQLFDLTRIAVASSRQADPTAFRVINACSTWGEYVASGRNYVGEMRKPVRSPFEYFQVLEDARLPYEAIGLQLYNPKRDMLEVERHLERFFVFGKPVHITELGISSSNEPITGGPKVRLPSPNVWHGDAWNEQIQADWAEQFYTLCYSKPQIQAITWWNLSDPAFIPHAGILDRNHQPKESYRRLKKLLAGWSG